MRGNWMRVAVLALGLVCPALGQAPDARPISRYLPAEGLAGFVEFDGLAAHRAAWEGTAARSILDETTTGAMLRSLLTQLLDAAESRSNPVSGEEVAALASHVVDHGFALSVKRTEEGASIPTAVLVVPGVAAGKAREALDSVVRAILTRNVKIGTVTRQDGSRLTIFQGRRDEVLGVSWFEGDDWVTAIGMGEEGDAEVRKVLAGQAPSIAESPARAELAKVDGDFTPVLRAWIDPAILPPTPPALGLGGLKGADYRWGFSGKALQSVLRVEAPAPRVGLLKLIDQPAITAANFPPIPAGTREYFVASLDLATVLDEVLATSAQVDPDARAQLDAIVGQIEAQTGRPLRADLAAFGPVMAGYVERVTIENSILPFGVMAQWLFRLPPAVAVAEVRDAGRAAGALDTLAEIVNGMLGMAQMPGGRPRLEKTTDGYRLDLPSDDIPLPTSIDPGVVLGPRYVAISTNRGAARRIVGGEVGERIVPGDLLRPGTIFLSVQDPSTLMPELIANLPFLVKAFAVVPPGGPMAMPGSPSDALRRVRIDPTLIPDAEAIRSRLFPGSTVASIDARGLTVTSREAMPMPTSMTGLPLLVLFGAPMRITEFQTAERAQSTNNLKQIGLAMANYESAYGHYPDDIRDADGKALLSWRVAILPFLEQQALYNEFHLNEAWDSEHNRQLMERMPPVYAAPGGRGEAEPGETFYQGFRGTGTMFDTQNGPVGIASITDGTSNTVTVVEAGEAVPWSAPEDLEFDPDPTSDLPVLGGMGWEGGFNALFADGSVRFVQEAINAMVVRAIISRAGGEVVSQEAITGDDGTNVPLQRVRVR